MGYVYKIVNKVSGKIYVGKTKSTVAKRWRSHVSIAIAGDRRMAVHSAMRRYPLEMFVVETLEEVTDSDLGARERFWIARLMSMAPTGYNLTPGGDGFTGPVSTSHREAIGEASRESWTNPSVRAKRSLGLRRARSTEDSRNRTSIAAKKVWFDQEFKEKMRLKTTKSWTDQEIRSRRLRGLRQSLAVEDFMRAVKKRKTKVFKCNHLVTIENSYLDSRGYLYCRACRSNRSAERRQ